MSTDVNINDVHDAVNDNDVEGSQKEAETEFTETPAIGNSRINLIGNGGASIEGIDAESATADTAADAAAPADSESFIRGLSRRISKRLTGKKKKPRMPERRFAREIYEQKLDAHRRRKKEEGGKKKEELFDKDQMARNVGGCCTKLRNATQVTASGQGRCSIVDAVALLIL